MTRKIFKILIAILIIVTLAVSYLHYFGLETSKFNNIIKEQIQNQNKRLDLNLKKVKLHLDLKDLSLKIKTINPTLVIDNSVNLELDEVSSNISINSYFQNKFAIKNLEIKSKKNEIKNYINLYRLTNNIAQFIVLKQIVKNGNLELNASINFDQSGKILNDYKLFGKISDTSLAMYNYQNIDNVNLNFEIVKENYNLKKISFILNKIKFNSDLLSIQHKNKIFYVDGNIKNKISNFDNKIFSIFFKNNFKNLDFANSKFDSDSKFSFKYSNKFKIQNLKIKSQINLDQINLKHNFKKINKFINNHNNLIELKKNNLNISYLNNEFNLNGSSELYFNDDIKNITNFKVFQNKKKTTFNSKINLSNLEFKIDDISYYKKPNKNAILEINGLKRNNEIIIKKINYIENENKLEANNLTIKNNKISTIDSLKFKYKTKNDFRNHLSLIKKNKDYELTGKSFDGEKLIENISNSNSNENFFDIFNNLSSKVKIKIKHVRLDHNNEINDLIGNLVLTNNKISNLDINSNFNENEKLSLIIKSKNDNSTITSFYSDRAKPFVKKYKFIKGFEEGNIIFNSTKIDNISDSRLVIDNFKVKEVPVLAKLLTLASLQGIADLLTGEGIRFTDFEMTYSNNGSVMTINEIYAIGPAISILMDGYIENEKLISLRGTLVPATTINRSIASIPLIGNILVGKKVGEGVFGVSFKIKGPPKDLKTSVNPIKTLTPRFITRTLEKIKKN